MAKINPIAAPPFPGLPYEQIEFVRLDAKRVPLYRVKGYPEVAGAFQVLGRAFERFGGECFYCGKKFRPDSFSKNKAHRDHVVADSSGGSPRLHNLVIACVRCGTLKANKPVRQFRPKAADKYLAILEAHISRALGSTRA
ncbi:MAG TPA: HNH endonuclease signature motif containing protein [Allosphingosinicella sp.]|nr:HNH endonuclease signature motif containing protein [Allosphingosinicella sp.]